MSGIMKFLLNEAFRRKSPASGTFELTARCNLDCRMCYIHKKENDKVAMSKEQPTSFWLELIPQLQRAGTISLLLTGGEPLLRRDFKEIYLSAKKAGMVVFLNTNAVLLNDEMIAFLAANPPGRVNVSLYGASEATYEALCGNGKVYGMVTENIRKLCKAGILVQLHYTVSQQNRDDAEAIYAFARELGLRVKAATYMFPPVRSCENGPTEISRMSPYASAQAQVQCMKLRFSSEEFSRLAALYANGAELPPSSELDDPRSPTERIRCRAGSSSFWVTFDGRMLPCGMMEQPYVSLREQSFSEAWEQLKELTARIYLPPQCSDCALRQYCEVCAANCYGENQRFDQPPRYLCEKAQAMVQLMKEQADTQE